MPPTTPPRHLGSLVVGAGRGTVRVPKMVRQCGHYNSSLLIPVHCSSRLSTLIHAASVQFRSGRGWIQLGPAPASGADPIGSAPPSRLHAFKSTNEQTNTRQHHEVHSLYTDGAWVEHIHIIVRGLSTLYECQCRWVLGVQDRPL
jgi:hypothetical protein